MMGRMRLRFSVRTLLFLILLLGLLALPVGLRFHRASEQQKMLQPFLRLGGEVHYEFEFRDDRTLKESVKKPMLANYFGADFVDEPVFLSNGWDGNITDNEFSAVRNFRKLELLYLAKTPQSGKAFANVQALTNLRGLCIMANPNFSAEWLVHIKNLKNLTTLSLPRAAISDDQLRHIKNLTNLKRLDLGETKISDAALAHLASLHNLQYLTVSGTSITGAGFTHLSGCNDLSTLFASDCPITDDGAEALCGLSNLEHLTVDGTRLSDRGIQSFVKIKSLVSLHISGGNINPIAMSALKGKMPKCRIAP